MEEAEGRKEGIQSNPGLQISSRPAWVIEWEPFLKTTITGPRPPQTKKQKSEKQKPC